MKVYVAASFLQKKKARIAITRLQEAGHQVTYDWTVHKTVKPALDHRGEMTVQAMRDLRGIEEAHILVLLWPGRYSSAAELGAALALRKPVYVVGKVELDEFFKMQLFLNHPLVTVVEKLSDLPLLKPGGIYAAV